MLPVATATDNVDGEITNIEVNTDVISQFYDMNTETYTFTTEGSYEVEYSVLDEAGNLATLILIINVTDTTSLLTSMSYTGYDGYYSSLSNKTTDEQVIDAIAHILRTTLTSYKGYDTSTTFNWILNTDKGGQYILYDTSTFVFDNGTWLTTGWNSGGLGYDFNGNGAYNPSDGDLFVDREHIWPANNMRIMPVDGIRTLNQFTAFVLNDGSFEYRPTGSQRGHFSDLHNMWNADRYANQQLHNDHYFGNTGVFW